MEPLLGEIRPFAFNFAPVGWAQCNGQILPISQYSALFSLLGTYYGGNGQTNFQLPNLQANVVVGVGQLDGVGTSYVVGETGGETGVQLGINEIPAHTHTLNGATSSSEPTVCTNLPANDYFSNLVTIDGTTTGGGKGYLLYPTTPPINFTNLNPLTLSPVGSGQAHSNLMPYLAITYCISLQGNFPQRN